MWLIEEMLFCICALFYWGLPRWSVVKNPLVNAGKSRDTGSVPGLGRSLEKEVATHSSILAWIIPWTKEPAGLQCMRSQRRGHEWRTEHAHMHFVNLFLLEYSCFTIVHLCCCCCLVWHHCCWKWRLTLLQPRRLLQQQPTPVFLPGESHGQKSLGSYGPWGHKESDTTKAT